MSMNLKDYRENYGDIPNDFYERFIYQLENSNIKDKDLISLRDKIRHIIRRKWNTINFVFYLEPSATPRPRLGSFMKNKGNKHRHVFVKGAKDHSELFAEFLETMNSYPTISTPCKLNIEIFSKTPSSMTKEEKILAELKLIDNISRPDHDNYLKRYSDMIQGDLILDDSLIVESSVRKKYSCKPRIEISIMYVEEHDCNYNKKKVAKWLCK